MDTPKAKKNPFDEEVKRALEQMSSMKVDSEEYATAVKNLHVLCDARGIKTTRSISADVLITAIANILGIVLVLQYEHLNVITSKAIGFAFRSRG